MQPKQMRFDQAAPPADWVAPRRTVIVATTPRSGSGWLGGLIRSAEQLGRPSEWFKDSGLDSREQVIEGANAVRTRGSTVNGISGVKLFPSYLEPILRQIRFSEWFPGAVWVHLQRRDLLGQAISLWRAYETDTWHAYASSVKSKSTSDRSAEGTPWPTYNPAAINLCLSQLCAFEADWRAFFGRTGITPLPLVYEDAVDDPDGTLRRVAALVGVSLPSEPIVHISKLAVQRDDASEEIRMRFRADMGDPDRPFRQLMAPGAVDRGVSDHVVAPRTISNIVRLLRGHALKRS